MHGTKKNRRYFNKKQSVHATKTNKNPLMNSKNTTEHMYDPLKLLVRKNGSLEKYQALILALNRILY